MTIYQLMDLVTYMMDLVTYTISCVSIGIFIGKWIKK